MLSTLQVLVFVITITELRFVALTIPFINIEKGFYSLIKKEFDKELNQEPTGYSMQI